MHVSEERWALKGIEDEVQRLEGADVRAVCVGESPLLRGRCQSLPGDGASPLSGTLPCTPVSYASTEPVLGSTAPGAPAAPNFWVCTPEDQTLSHGVAPPGLDRPGGPCGASWSPSLTSLLMLPVTGTENIGRKQARFSRLRDAITATRHCLQKHKN